jgi:polysaccharide pyruvyl transferase WcaK-like protein
LRAANVNNIIVAGGEVLGTRWFNMHLHISTPPLTYLLKGLRKGLGLETADQVSRALLKVRDYPLPWLLPHTAFASAPKLIYNAVGGGSNIVKLPLAAQAYLADTLEQATYVSVRDRYTQNVLADLGVSAQLAPDSAALMAQTCRDLSASEGAQALTHDPYLTFQVSKHHARHRAAELARALDDLQNHTGYNILLLPIGRAPAHEDHVALEHIRTFMHTPALMPAADSSISDIMHLIAHSQVFIGSSLHGAITAMAFAVPHLALTGIAKLTRYLDTWDIPEQQTPVDACDLVTRVDEVLQISPKRRQDLAEQLEQASWDNFRAIYELLS